MEGVPQKKIRHFSSRFTLISAHTNFHDPRTTHSGRKVIRYRERRERKEKNEFSGHYVCHAAHLQQRTGSARTSLGPIMVLIVATMFAWHPFCNASGQCMHSAQTKK
jgi:hypothetical protein